MDIVIEVAVTIFSFLKSAYMIFNFFTKTKELPEVLTMEWMEGTNK